MSRFPGDGSAIRYTIRNIRHIVADVTTAQPSEVEPDLARIVARRARGFIAENRLQQTKLALQLGMSRSAFNDRLNDVKDFNLRELPAVADALGTTVAYLIGSTEDSSPRQMVPGGGSMFLPVGEGGTPSRTRTANPLIKSHTTDDDAAVLPFRRRPAATASTSAHDAAVLAFPNRSAS